MAMSPRAANAMVERAIAEAGLSSATIAAAAHRKGLQTHGATAEEAVASLRRLPVEALDPLAVRLTRPQCVAAAAQGFATSVGGLATLPLRLSADAAFALWFAVRATSGAMGAFGFPPETPQGQALLRAGLLTVSGAAGRGAWDGGGGGGDLLGAAARHVTVDPSGTRMLASSARLLMRRLASRTGRGQLGRAAPFVGGLVGAGVNASAVQLIARRARHHYRELLTQWQHAIDAGDVAVLDQWPHSPGTASGPEQPAALPPADPPADDPLG